MSLFSIGQVKFWKKRRKQSLIGRKKIDKMFKSVHVRPPQSRPLHTNDPYLYIFNNIDFSKMTALKQNIRLPFLATVNFAQNDTDMYQYLNNPYMSQRDIVSAHNDAGLAQIRRENRPIVHELKSLKHLYMDMFFNSSKTDTMK